MRPIDSSLILGAGFLVVLTSKDLAGNSKFMVADFRDMLALVYKPTGSYIGMNEQGIRLGKRPVEMVDGVWTMEEDAGLLTTHQNVQLSPELLSLEMIR